MRYTGLDVFRDSECVSMCVRVRVPRRGIMGHFLWPVLFAQTNSCKQMKQVIWQTASNSHSFSTILLCSYRKLNTVVKLILFSHYSYAIELKILTWLPMLRLHIPVLDIVSRVWHWCLSSIVTWMKGGQLMNRFWIINSFFTFRGHCSPIFCYHLFLILSESTYKVSLCALSPVDLKIMLDHFSIKNLISLTMCSHGSFFLFPVTDCDDRLL